MRVQAHLARAELGDEWDEVEKNWQKAEQKLDQVQDQAIETTAEMQRSAKVIMEEIAEPTNASRSVWTTDRLHL